MQGSFYSKNPIWKIKSSIKKNSKTEVFTKRMRFCFPKSGFFCAEKTQASKNGRRGYDFKRNFIKITSIAKTGFKR